MAKQIVTLQTVKYLEGRTSKGEPRNEVIDVKLPYPSMEWMNYIKHIKNTGINKVTVVAVKEEVTDGKKKEYKDVQIPDSIVQEVNKAFSIEADKPMTEDQKRIAELEAKIEKLLGAQKEESKDDSELNELRAKYVGLAGKKGSPKWDVETLKEKIAELEAE